MALSIFNIERFESGYRLSGHYGSGKYQVLNGVGAIELDWQAFTV